MLEASRSLHSFLSSSCDGIASGHVQPSSLKPNGVLLHSRHHLLVTANQVRTCIRLQICSMLTRYEEPGRKTPRASCTFAA